MADISAQMIKDLRERTGAGMADCKKALTECAADMEKAIDYLRKKGIASAAKKATRIASEGTVASYLHGSRIGVMVEVNCETDFVARNPDFVGFAREIAMQIAAMNAQYVSQEEIPPAIVEREKAVRMEQAKQSGKPESVIPKIIEGQLAKWSKEICLLDQVWVKDPEGKKDIRALLTDLVAKTGENVRIRRFIRFEVGEGLEKRSDDFVVGGEETGWPGVSEKKRSAHDKNKAKAAGEARETNGGSNGAGGLSADLDDPPRQPLAPGVKYRRILLKLSGEALMGGGQYGIDPTTLAQIADEIIDVHNLGVEIALVLGGGNIFRGIAASSRGMDRAHADYMGMLATVINSLALQAALESRGSRTRVLSAIEMERLAEPYIRRRAIRHLEKGRLVIFAAGTGNPFFTTDTAASLRAMEIGAEIVMKATKVDGVYDKDPQKHKDARMFRRLSYLDVLNRNLAVMDSTAISLCRDNNLPILVFNMTRPGNIRRVVLGEPLGTMVMEERQKPRTEPGAAG